MKTFIILVCLLGVTVQSSAEERYVKRNVKLSYMNYKTFSKMGKKQKLKWLSELRSFTTKYASQSPKKSAFLQLYFLNEAYAQASNAGCFDAALNYRESTGPDGSCPAPTKGSCYVDGQVQCSPFLFGENICVSSSDVTSACNANLENSKIRQLEIKSYRENNGAGYNRIFSNYEKLCKAGSPAQRCADLVQAGIDANVKGAENVIVEVVSSKSQVEPNAESPLATDFKTPSIRYEPSSQVEAPAPPITAAPRPVATQNTEAENIEKPAAVSSAAPEPQVAVKGRPVQPRVSGQASRSQEAPEQKAAVASAPVKEAKMDYSTGTVDHCATGSLTHYMNLGGGDDRKNFLSDVEVRKYFCSNKKLSTAEAAEVRAIAKRNSARVTATRGSLTIKSDVVGLMNMLERCIRENQRGDFPPGRPKVKLSCKDDPSNQYGFCKISGRPLTPNGSPLAFTSRVNMGSIINGNRWQWCQVEEGHSVLNEFGDEVPVPQQSQGTSTNQ